MSGPARGASGAAVQAARTRLKAKLRSRQTVFGAWTSLFHPSIAEIFAESGVDFVGIDIEHSTIDLAQCLAIIAACQAHGVPCLPRIASHNMEMIKRLLDSGADGIVVPMVSTPEEVEQLVGWTKYPPLGRRSYGIARAQGYGFDFEEYTRNWNATSTLIIQIESEQGVRNIDSLLKHEAVDGAMIGPYDLSGSMGIPGQLDHPSVIEASRKVNAQCEAFGRASGTQLVSPDPESIERARAAGHTFIVLASDIFILWKWAERMRTLTRAEGSRPAAT